MQISKVDPDCKSPFAYDYSTIIDNDTAEQVKFATTKIHACGRQASALIIEIGKQLTAVRSLLDHGQFIDWLGAEFHWSTRTAQRYMRVAEVFGDKSDTVSLLEPSALYLLSSRSTPEVIVGEAIAKLKNGERVGRDQLLAEIREARTQPTKKSRARFEPAQEINRCLKSVTQNVEVTLDILEDDAEHCRLLFESVRQRLSEIERERSPEKSATAEAEAAGQTTIAETAVKCDGVPEMPPFLIEDARRRRSDRAQMNNLSSPGSADVAAMSDQR